MKTLIEVDDLWHKEQIKELLVPLRTANPGIIVNAFAIPNKLGDVKFLKEAYPWIRFCIHGFEHTHFECAEWTFEKGVDLIGKALKMGYDPVFKAPNYYMDQETDEACNYHELVLVHNDSYIPKVPGTVAYPGKSQPAHLRLSAHLVTYPGSSDFIQAHRGFHPKQLQPLTNFCSIQEFVHDK